MGSIFVASYQKEGNVMADTNKDKYIQDLSELSAIQTALPSSIVDSWDQKFFTDLYVVDMDALMDGEGTHCPLTHP